MDLAPVEEGAWLVDERRDKVFGYDLGDVAPVAEHGIRVDACHLPAERAVAHHVDLAPAYSYVARDDEALDQLLDTEASGRRSIATAPPSVTPSSRCTDTPDPTPDRHRCSVWPMRCRATE